MKCYNWQLFPLSAIVLVLSLSGAYAQKRNPPGNLPKAGFNIYTRPQEGEDNQLPVMDGLHLTPGKDRKPNALPEVYNPGEQAVGMKLVQWDRRRFPLKIWISMGKKLPEEPLSQLQQTRPDEVYKMLRDPKSVWDLPECPGWNPDMNLAVANGIEQWREFENEGLLSFGFVDRPEEANILVFFVDHFVSGDAPGGVATHGNTCAKIFDVQDIRLGEQKGYSLPQYPVVIELQVVPEYVDLQANAAHEFGHALGIKAHSPYRDDIMHENRHKDVLSASDKATLRWLYRQHPQYFME